MAAEGFTSPGGDAESAPLAGVGPGDGAAVEAGCRTVHAESRITHNNGTLMIASKADLFFTARCPSPAPYARPRNEVYSASNIPSKPVLPECLLVH